jgi:glutamate synthase (NADPH/NADH) large chain
LENSGLRPGLDESFGQAPGGETGAAGLYRSEFEHDACGVAFVVDIAGRASHDMVEKGLGALCHLEHRGAQGAEYNSGDGAGILIQIPDRFLRAQADLLRIQLPTVGRYVTGIGFLPADSDRAEQVRAEVEAIAAEEGLVALGWRRVPVDDSRIGSMARSTMPGFEQVFLARPDALVHTDPPSEDERLGLERQAFVVRKRTERELEGVYFPSLSCRTLVYKGMLTSDQLQDFYPELSDPRMESALALVHSRFSTNTFPSWPLAHPYRYLAHNGEINTLAGNRNWMRARESLMQSSLIPGDLERICPVVTPGASDSATVDEVLELLHLGGRSLAHSILMMIPEAFENHQDMDPARRAFYQFHSCVMEPWDGPASIAFTDGTVIGAVLDRNGLRPSRYWVTDDGLVIMASEVGVLPVPPERVVAKGRLQPGRIFLVDTSKGRIVGDEEIKEELAKARPYQEWLDSGLIRLRDLPSRFWLAPRFGNLTRHQQLFGFTNEELNVILAPMAVTGAEPVGSMGDDTPLAVLSDRPQLIFDYFAQLFAQVTNPPLDAIREELVTSIQGTVGPEGNLLEPTADSCKQILLDYPVLDSDEMARLLYINERGETPGFKARAIDGVFEVGAGGAGLAEALDRACAEASAAIEAGVNILVLSDRHSSATLAPIPSLLLTSAVHHHLIRERSRTRVALLVEAGDVRETHHVALLIGYGAAAVHPYLALETIESMVTRGQIGVAKHKAVRNYVKACSKGVLKVMSKMGISTVASYTGAQVFEATGLSSDLVDRYFTGTISRIEGIGLDEIAAEVRARHDLAYLDNPVERAHRLLEVGGEYQWRREGEYHLFNPETVFKLQHSTRSGRYDIFKQYTKLVNEQSERLVTLRSLLRLKTDPARRIPLEEVEPVSSIVKRFATGAMSYGSISKEAHETLAIAMNRLGGRSNTGEGGEDADRYQPDANGDLRRSAIKQVASGRFGVTSEYLVNADDIQIKMAQGAKPGEGGQLPGSKVYPWIAKTRLSTPGVGLISPPPHHDIYSIEDLAQLIHDLKSANPRARINVKLVAETGVGTVAAGVAKAHADVVQIAGHDGGTGASPLTSIKHAGGPWELGLAEAQQTLMRNGLRDRIVVQVDGQLKTGRDVVVAALLGAEEFGFATAPLVVSGCIMMRVCHLDTCPVGVATQNPELRRRFSGKPEFVVNFFEFLAEEVRELLASLGLRSIEEAVGRVDLLEAVVPANHPKAAKLDLRPILAEPEPLVATGRFHSKSQDHGLEKALDHAILAEAKAAIENGEPVRLDLPITNRDRTVGALLGYEITSRYGGRGLPPDTLRVGFTGSAGQSFGAFLPAGVVFDLEGDANDYLGKGLSGGRLIVRAPAVAPFKPAENVIAGNVILYGATSGEAYINGLVGERFAVRNSGATAVVEGVGDHGCEYMTGGRVVVLGPTGRNFGAGMSGGVAYVFDPRGTFPSLVNMEMVELDPLEDEDVTMLESLIRTHRDLTNSDLATEILANWSVSVAMFVKVMPTDYKRVMEELKRAEMVGANG